MKILTRIPVTIIFTILAFIYLPSINIIHEPYSAIMKALPTLLLIAAISYGRGAIEDKMSYDLATIALVFSIIGDAFGDLKSTVGDLAFLGQIAFFSVAQITYGWSFCKHVHSSKWETLPWNLRYIKLVFCILVVGFFWGYGFFLMKSINEKMLYYAVAIYMTLIVFMGISAILQVRKESGYFIAGALSFIISDSLLAYDAFVGGFPFRDELVMWTYYAAQMLLNMALIRKTREARA